MLKLLESVWLTKLIAMSEWTPGSLARSQLESNTFSALLELSKSDQLMVAEPCLHQEE